MLGGGGYAQYANIKYDMLMPVPKNCSMVEAAAIPEAFATAYLNLFIEGNIKEGDTLLMNAGASGPVSYTHLKSFICCVESSNGITIKESQEKFCALKFISGNRPSLSP